VAAMAATIRDRACSSDGKSDVAVGGGRSADRCVQMFMAAVSAPRSFM